MKESTELIWIINLITSPYIKRLFSKNSASIKELEIISGSATNNKVFRKWFKEMLDKRCFELGSIKSVNYNSKEIQTYFVNKINFLKVLKNMDLFNKLYKVSYEDYLSLKL